MPMAVCDKRRVNTMNPKIQKLRVERLKNDKNIDTLRTRNGEIDKQIMELENLDIVGLVRSIGMTPEQLAAMLKTMKTPPVNPEKDGASHG